jgi:uncharacterized surface protein with fasciclin (FAS1) repeats
MKTILETAAAAGKFATLLSAIKAAGLTDSLNGKGPFTVFAPTDEAFQRLGAGSIESLLKDAPKLKKILSYHVVPGAINAKDVRPGDIKSLEGSAIVAAVADGRVTLNNVHVVQADIAASNGVIHVIDGVLMPKSVTLAAAA